MTTLEHAETSTRRPMLAAAGVWLIPLYCVLLTLTTLTHEPDHTVDFAAWSRYVTTDVFVVSHIAGSILGAGLGLVGVMCALVFLVRGTASTTALIGAALTVVGNVLFVGIFSLAAYAQPAIGRAFLAGQEGAEGLYDEVYGVPMLTTLAIGMLAFVAGALLFGRAVAATSPSLRWAGWGYGVMLVLFVVTGFSVQVLQPISGLLAAAAAVVIARRLPLAVR
jgi:hypothetical protein